MELSENQKQRLANINYVVGSVALLGSIGGVIYSHKTGGGFWRGFGYWILGGLILGTPASLISLPFRNKILKESDLLSNNPTSKSSDNNDKLSGLDWDYLRTEAINAAQRSKTANQFSRLVTGTESNTTLRNNFINNVSRDEYNALVNFYKVYNTTMTDAFSKISPDQKILVQKATSKIFPTSNVNIY